MGFKRIGFYILILTIVLTTSNVYARRGCCSWHKGVSGQCSNGRIVCNDGTLSPSCTCDGGSTRSQAPSYIYGCTDKNSVNYNANANRDDGSCIKKVYGCTDPDAYNYDANANTDSGNCIDKKEGCTDSKAINYDREANIKDDSCQYKNKKVKYEKIKYKTKYRFDLFMKEGSVITKGRNGKRKITSEVITDEQGNIISETIVSKKVVKKAKDRVIAKKELV